MDNKLKQWRAADKHLPRVMRDFHSQKAIFQAMHEMTQLPAAKEGEHRAWAGDDISWVTGQCYVLDRFLWFMARHGYTLQRSRAKLSFDSLSENLALLESQRVAALKAMLTPTPPASN